MPIFFLTTNILMSLTLFARAYGGTSTDYADYPNAIVQTTDGGFAIAGYTRSFGQSDGNFFVLKLDPNGALQWAKGFGGATLKNERAYSVIQTTDGGYVIVGRTQSYGAGLDDFLVLKINSDGSNIVWAKTFGGPGTDYGYSVVQTTDGYAVAGSTLSFGAGGYDFLVLKLDSDGGLVWAKTFGGTGDDAAWCVIQATDGGLVVAGYTGSFGAGSQDFLVLKLDSDGGLDWAKTFGGAGGDFAYSITQTADGGYFVGGFTGSFGVGVPDFLVVKLDSDGGLEWTKAFGGENWDYAYSVTQTADEGYVIAGSTLSFGIGQYDCLLVKMAKDGAFQWARTFGGAANDEAHSVTRTTDGGCVVAGYTANFGAVGPDILVLRLDSEGNYADCVLECSPLTTVPALEISSPIVGADCSPAVNIPTMQILAINPTVIEACEPVYEDVGEVGSGSHAGITCLSLAGGLLLISPDVMDIRLYSADGRLAYFGKLEKGQNRIPLDQGVYIWSVENYKGKAVVR
ncbi:MAG: T9SS type A sorting domain-containing protein [candidate division WOR-3 bacterium]